MTGTRELDVSGEKELDMNRRGDLCVIIRGDILMGQMMGGEGCVNEKKDLDLEEGKAGYDWGR
jgi:hypothetical protein